MPNFNHYNHRGQNNGPSGNMAARYRTPSPTNHQQRNQNSFSQAWPPPPSFSQPPPRFSTPPPGSGWVRGPPPPFSVPPPGFSGPPPASDFPGSNSRPPNPRPLLALGNHQSGQSGPPGHESSPSQPPPLFGSPPPFSVPSPMFRGTPPYSGQSPRFSSPPPFSSAQGSNSGPRPQMSNSGFQRSNSEFQRSNSGSDPSPFQKRAVNNVWSDSSVLHPEQKYSGQAGYDRGGQGSQRGMCHVNRGRGRGRGGGADGRHQFQQGQGQSQGPGNKKKNKANKERQDSSDNDKFLCEVCDRGFKTQEKYQQHVDEHTKCFVEGCPYVAAPKLVQLHYNTQHKTGLAEKIWSTESPEDIKKWIEERKRNYPTAENKARKSRLEAERRARGEVIENKQFGNMRGRGRGGRGHRGHEGRGRGNFKGKRHHEREDSPSDSTQDSKSDCVQRKSSPSRSESAKKRRVETTSDVQENKSVEVKDPLSLILGEDDDRDSDDDDNKPATTSSKALTSLVTSYDLSDKEDDLAQESKTTNGRRDEEGEKEESHEWKNGNEESEIRWRKEEPEWKRLNRRLRNQRHNKKDTLLERLLAGEIRHERNVVLQCVHFIVNNNFLGILDRHTETIGK